MSIEMAGKRKKMAAALAAVSLYLEQEEEAVDEQRELLKQRAENTGLSYWGQSGRQEMMDMRRLTQLRAVRF